MTDVLWRLIWALPLVLLTGLTAVLVLKRILVPIRSVEPPAQRMSLHEVLTPSDLTRVYLIEVDRQTYLLVESVGGTVLQNASIKNDVGGRAYSRFAVGPQWAQRLLKSVLR